MISISESFEKEFNKMERMEEIKGKFVSKNENEFKRIFGYIFVINYFKNKAETKRFFGTNYNMTFSLLLESIYALFTGQCRSALLLLRSGQEANYKFVLEREREFMLDDDLSLTFEPLDYRFINTKRKFTSDLLSRLDNYKFKEYFTSIERNLTLYKQLSSVVHSISSRKPVMSVEYFSNIHEETIVDEKKFFRLFSSVLNEVFLLDFFLIRESLLKWDYFVLYNLLRILYGDKRTRTLIRIVKDK